MTTAGHNQSKNIPEELRAIDQVVRDARSVLIRQAFIDAAARGFFWGSLIAAVAVVAARLSGLGVNDAWWFMLIAAACAALGLFVRRTAVPDGYREAKRIDDQLGLEDRLAGGYDLLRRVVRGDPLPATPFVPLMLRDAADAAEKARLAMRGSVHLPRGMMHGIVCLALAASVSLFVLPGDAGMDGGELTDEQLIEIAEFNRTLAEYQDTIRAMDWLDDEEKNVLLKVLGSVAIDREELRKRGRADILRRLREANAKIKISEGVYGAAMLRALDDKIRAIAEMKQVQQQLMEIEAINRRQAVIDLGDGRSVSLLNIKLESSDLQIDQAIAAVLAKPGEGELEYQRRAEAAEARAKAEREKIKRFLVKAIGKETLGAEGHKLAALLADDAEFQNKVMEAIKNPGSKTFDAMREIYRRQLEREFERENIPRGLRQQLSTYLGRRSTEKDADSR